MCVCDPGRSGADCSTDDTKAPTLVSISNLGLCDLSSRNCTDVTLYGTNFVNKATLTCHLQGATVSDIVSSCFFHVLFN